MNARRFIPAIIRSPHRTRHSRNGCYGIFGRGRVGSLRLDARRLDHLGPLLGFVSDELAEFGGGEDHRRGGRIGEPRLDDRVCEPVINLAVEPLDDLVWRTPRDADTLPRALASKPGTTSLTVGTSGSPANRVLPTTARARNAPDRMWGSEAVITSNATCTCPLSKIGHHGRGPAIGYVNHVDAGHHLEQLACHMR